MSWERSDYSEQDSNSLWVPSPVSPIYSIWDFFESSTAEVFTWEYVIPHDHMVYSLCAFFYTANQITWLHSRIKLNDDYIWWKLGGIGHKWTPGYKSAIRMHGGDVLEIVCNPMMPRLYQYCWQIDFWRDPIND